eukprot:Skav221844  [mRNA]  locus=scaffold126:113800:115425:+ [translate_table: standard]
MVTPHGAGRTPSFEAWEAREDEQALAYLTQAGVNCWEQRNPWKVRAGYGQAELEDATKRLTEAGIPFKLWVEQPEDFLRADSCG